MGERIKTIKGKAAEWKPDRKHAGEAATLIVVWLVGVFGFEVPAEVAGAAIFLTGYLIPNPQ